MATGLAGIATAAAGGPRIGTSLDALLASAPPTVVKATSPGDVKRGTILTSLPAATVSDDVTPAGSLAVAEVFHNAGLGPVTNVTNTGGNVTVDVSVSCSGQTGNKGLSISATDGDNQTADDSADALLIHVIADTNPVLGYPPTPSVPAGQSSTINPTSGPSDNGTFSIAVQPGAPTFVSVDNATGVVTAAPASGDAGNYPVTVRITDNCGRITDAAFTLTVSPPSAVTMRSLSARSVRGGVQLRWSTAQESGLLGFNVYRLQNGKLMKANRRLIATVVDGRATGHAYSWLDRTGPGRAQSGRYRLQGVDPDGTVRWLGATSVAPSAAPAQASFVHFTSPSGNIDCLGDTRAPAFVECTVQHATWPHLPPKPARCDLDWSPTELDLGHRRVSVGACRGDVGPLCGAGSQRCTTLGYGHSVDIGSIRCTSATNGVTCRYRTAPRVGFRVARQGYTVFHS